MEEIGKALTSWVKRRGLQISDVYRNTSYYVDVVDDVGGKYEISISKDGDSDLFKVRVWNHQKKSCGFRPLDSCDLETVLEQAYLRIITWMKQAKGTQLFAA